MSIKRTVSGVGYNTKTTHKVSIKGKHTLAYSTWKHMIQRCYCPKVLAKHPTYIGCTVMDDWHDFQNFAEWFYNHEFSHMGYHIDKDLLYPGNKVYSPKTVCFVPREINNLLLHRGNAQGKHKQGVTFMKSTGKYLSQISLNGKRKYLGTYTTEEEAHIAYKEHKEAYVKSMALEWQSLISTEVYLAMMNWEL